ncbi:MAG: aminotransferase class I/II-fold pyridoxal phosphate-dependent enzyme, partial [Bacteroidota bacterium]
MTDPKPSESRPSFNPHKWVRRNIRALIPYHAARDDYHEGILLDANENSFGPAIPTDLPLHRYPDTRLNDLRQKWADFRGLNRDQVFVGVGSDEAIDLLMRVFCEPGQDEII